MNKILLVILTAIMVSACTSTGVNYQAISSADKAKLATAIAARSDEDKTRDGTRNPQQTLEFFGITPGMTVVEVLPGGGWYTKILAPYLAVDGALYGVNYSNETWPLFGFFSEEQIAQTIARTAAFADSAEEYAGQPIKSGGMSFGRIDSAIEGSVDAVLFIRAIHNLHRFEKKGGTLTQAIADTSKLLKTGGIVGVVQHLAPESNSDDWANGDNGYLKRSMLLQVFDEAGYDLVGESMINANPKDQPSENDVVWRLPPTLNVGKLEGEAKEAAIAKYKEIGESNRITLKFVKR